MKLVVGILLLVVGLILVLLSLPVLGFSALAFMGILADVGPDENRMMGLQLLTFGGPAFLLGVALAGLSWFLLMRRN